MRLVRGIKVRPGGASIRRATIAEFMNVKTMFAGSEARYISVNLHPVGDLGKRDRAAYFVAPCRVKHRNRF
jgi:hypothetical protein